MTDAYEILVVDDDESGRYFKARVLKGAGYTVSEAGSAAAALAEVGNGRAALVVLDVRLPDMPGTEVCARIKALDRRIMVLQTSAAVGRVEGLEGGADSYLAEPIEPDELTGTVRALLRLRRSEDDLRAAGETLQQKVMERTVELAAVRDRLIEEMRQRAQAEEILRHTQKLDAIGKLTGGIAHDFNNMLAVVLGNLGILRRQLDAPAPNFDKMRRAVDNALVGGERAVSITRRLLGFARRQPLEIQRIDTNAALQQMRPILQHSLEERIEVRLDLGNGAWPANTDPSQLENAVLNLALNARDAMTSGGSLTIATSNATLDAAFTAPHDAPPGDYVCIAVTDTGTGMSPEVQAFAFEPFFTTKDVGHGTGLGLAQVHGFAKQSRGFVTIDSVVGRGTTMRLYLSRAEAAARTAVAEEAAVEHNDGAATALVLLVEDDHTVRATTALLLREIGYSVVEAENGRQALVQLANPAIDVLFTDVGLPGGMDGVELSERARALRPELPVLFATAYSDKLATLEDRVPDARVIAKPFSYSALATHLHQLLATLARQKAASRHASSG